MLHANCDDRSFRASSNDTGSSFLWFEKPVPLSAVGALTGRAGKPVFFSRIEGYEIPVVDLLFVDRPAQARVLECEREPRC